MAEKSGPPWPGFVDALSTVLMMMVFFTLLMVLVVGTLSYIVALKEVNPEATVATEEPGSAEKAAKALPSPKPESSIQQLSEALKEETVLEQEDLEPVPIPPVVDIDELEQEKAKLKALLDRARAEIKELKKARSEETNEELKKALERIAELESGGEIKKVKSEETYEPPPFVTKLVKGIGKENRIIILYNQLTSTVDDTTRKELLAWLKKNKQAAMSKGIRLTATLNHSGVSSSMSGSVSYKRLYALIKIVNEEGGIPKSKIRFKAMTEGVPGTNQVVIKIGDK